MNKTILLALALLAVGSVRAQAPERFFQFTSAVPHCPVPLGPSQRSALDGEDAMIGTELRAALSKGQLYTHSPLVNSSLWASVTDRIVTVEGCIAGDAYTSFDHASLRTQIENIGKTIAGVRQTVVLVRTADQTQRGLPVPYRVKP